jgi:hypothetical protein
MLTAENEEDMAENCKVKGHQIIAMYCTNIPRVIVWKPAYLTPHAYVFPHICARNHHISRYIRPETVVALTVWSHTMRSR